LPVIMSLAGYLHYVYLGTVSTFYVMILVQSFFGPDTFAIVGPYMTELWPAPLRASGLGLAYGTSNLGKFIGPLGLALIAGTSNYIKPEATLAAIIPAFNYFASWYVLVALPSCSSGSRRAAARSKSSTTRSGSRRASRCPARSAAPN